MSLADSTAFLTAAPKVRSTFVYLKGCHDEWVAVVALPSSPSGIAGRTTSRATGLVYTRSLILISTERMTVSTRVYFDYTPNWPEGSRELRINQHGHCIDDYVS
ncbi:hypothetical protein DPEC_G00138630 [Dallia pectoralis]|uniref:Uncharacterized protein n=1 Tax=Dallia pectoralis TaxID=75939 RepID=A0ACC2GMI2_DALPE|nr:hypothetical protein DPEC_G00138630 [Dallia pectoralis]